MHDISQIMRPGFHSPTRETRIISHARPEEERPRSVRNMSPRRGSDAAALEDLSRMEGLSPRSRASPASSPRADGMELQRQNSRPVALASVQRRYREMFDRKSSPQKQAQARAAAPPASLSLAELEQREHDDDNSPLPPDLETPHHSVVLEAAPEASVAKPWHDSPAVHAQPAAAVETGSPDSGEGSVDGIDSELWCKAVTMALAFRGFRQGCEVSRTERRQAESEHQQLQSTKAELAAKTSENAQLKAELAAAKQKGDQAVRSLRGQEAQQSEMKSALKSVQAERDEAVRELQSVKGERSALLQQTEQLAAELNQLREDWFASWEAEQALSASASASAEPHQQQDVSLGDDTSPASQERDDSYLKYLKVDKAESTLEETVDLSWWKPTADEEKRRQKDASRILPLAQLQEEWSKVRTTQEELRQMQTKVDAKRTRLRRQLAQHGWSTDGDEIHAAPRKYVGDEQ